MASETTSPEIRLVESVGQERDTEYICEQCQRVFQRPDHLERHARCHLQLKPFPCQECNKSFARKDTLKRHMVTHGYQFDGHSNRVAQACINCTRSKQRCSGRAPCDRCKRKNVQCNFVKQSGQLPKLQSNASPPTTPGSEKASERDGQLLWPRSPDRMDCAVPMTPDLFTRNAMGDVIPFEPAMPAYPGSLWDIAFPLPLANSANDTRDITFSEFGDQPLQGYPQVRVPEFQHDRHFPTASSTTTSLSEMDQTEEATVGSSHNPSLLNNKSGYSASHALVFPILSLDELDLIHSEDFCHVPRLSEEMYSSIAESYQDTVIKSSNALEAAFPSLEVINTFIQLYFEFFQPGLPLLHQPTFNCQHVPAILILAVAAIGSQYSALRNRGHYAAGLLELVRRDLSNKLNSGGSFEDDIHLAQATLLFVFAMTFIGKREAMIQAQYLRNLLITMCRPFLAASVLFQGVRAKRADIGDNSWSDWVKTESWTRVVYFTWVTEYLHWIFLDLAPLISISDLQASLPSDDKIWQCSNPDDFARWTRSEAGSSRPPSVLNILRDKDFSKEKLQSLSPSALLVLVISVHAEEGGSSRLSRSELYESKHDNAEDGHGERSGLPSRNADSPADQSQVEKSNIFRFVSDAVSTSTGPLSLANKIYKILSILRYIPLSLLYVSSGWMATQAEKEIALQKLSQKLQAEPQQARRALVYAAQLFKLLRDQPLIEGYDPLCLLVAALYIWFYDLFLGIPPSTDFSTGQLMKIDRDLDKDLIECWVNQGESTPIHIAGIGVLNGGHSISRSLKEAIRILTRDRGWPQFAFTISCALRKVLSGSAPLYDVIP